MKRYQSAGEFSGRPNLKSVLVLSVRVSPCKKVVNIMFSFVIGKISIIEQRELMIKQKENKSIIINLQWFELYSNNLIGIKSSGLFQLFCPF